MNKFRTVASVIIMVIAGIIGFFIGVAVGEAMGGAILFSMIAGIACVVYAIDNSGKTDENPSEKDFERVARYREEEAFLKNVQEERGR